MPGVHGLEHVERGGVSNLTYDDPVRAHAQAVAEQLTDGQLTAALHVGGAELESDQVRMAHLQLGRVFDRDDALLVGDEPA